MRKWLGVLAMVVMAFTLTTGSVAAAAPQRLFPYTKQTSLKPGTYDFRFRLYDSTTATTPLWSSGKVTLRLRTPVLVYTLGSGTVKIPASIDFSKQLYVNVVKTGPGSAVTVANRERLAVSPYAMYGAATPPITPIVLGESAGNWRTASTSAPTTFEILGPDAFLGATGIAPPATGNNVAYSLPLTQPALVGGTGYRLASVEYCVRTVNASVKVDSASIFSDSVTPPSSLPLTAEVIDNTDRAAVGCYTVETTNGTGRAYAFVLSVAQVSGTTGGMIISGVRSTWLPATGPVGPAVAASGGDPVQVFPRALLKRIAQ